MKVVFFNHFHNGDVHVSRGFIRQIMNKMPDVSFTHTHRNSPSLLSDIPNLGFDPNIINSIANEHAGTYTVGDTTYINTWYAQQRFRYMNRFGITIDSLYAAFDDTCKSLWGFSLTDISAEPRYFFPAIDYSRFKIQDAQNWLYLHPEKKIFVENAHANSDQATNFDLTTPTIELALKHQDKTFILSNQFSRIQLPHNVVYSRNIIQSTGLSSDLNENSFLSSHCDVIIGRASGPFTFSLTQENLFVRHPKFICFSNLVPVPPNKFWVNELLRDKVNYSAEIIVENVSSPDRAKQIIDANL